METKMEEMKTKEVRNMLAEEKERGGREKTQINISVRGPSTLASGKALHLPIHQLSINSFLNSFIHFFEQPFSRAYYHSSLFLRLPKTPRGIKSSWASHVCTRGSQKEFC